MVLAGNLLKDIQRMPANPAPQTKARKGDTKLVFIGYGAAGWVIQEALAWYSNTSTQTATRTAMVILLNLPPITSKAALKTYLERFPKLYPGEGKTALEFPIVEIIQNNFEQLQASWFAPQQRRITISGKANTSPTNTLKAEVLPQNDSVLRRETSDTHHTSDSSGSNSTDTSKDSNGSGTALNVEQIPLWEIVTGDKTDEDVKHELRTSLTLEKPANDTTSQPHKQPEYQAVDQNYGSIPAKDFLPRRVPTGFSTKSAKLANFYNRLNSPPTPPEEKDDPIATAVLPGKQTAILEDSQAVENTRELLGSNWTPPSSAPLEVYIDPNPERSYTPTEMDTVTNLDAVTETDEDSVRQEISQETGSKDSPKPNLSAERQLLRLAFLYQQSGELQKSKTLYQRLVKLPAMAQGIDIIMTQIAITWIYEGKVKMAQKVFSDLEPKVEAEYNKEPQRTWEVKRWLAISLDMQGLYESGRQKLMNISEAFTSFQQAQQVTDVGLLTRSTLALVFGHLGKYEEALTRSKEVLQLAVKAVEKAKERAKAMNGGKGDPAYVTRQQGALGSIQFDRAKILTYVGRYEEAETMNSQALENIQRNVGSKHVSTLECWSLKARHFASTCRLPEAEEQCQKTLKVMRKEIGKEHPSTLKTLGVLVYVYRLQARLTEALDTAKYLLEKCKVSEAFGENHPETINSMWQLAEVYLARGDFSNALYYQAQAVDLADKILGKFHPTVVNYRACLARVYCNRGNWAKSAMVCFDVLGHYGAIISEASKGGQDVVGSKPEEPEDAKALLIFNIQKALEKGKVKSGTQSSRESIVQSLLDRARHLFIVDNDDFETLNLSLVSTMQCLGVTERERQHGNLEVAQEIQTKAHEYIEKKLGEDHADTLSSKWDLALTKLKRGQDGALSELAYVTASRRRVLGEDHPDTLAARHHLSVAKFNMYHNLNELDEQAEVLRLCIYLLGEEHPTTNSARIDLSNGYHMAGMLHEAEQLRMKALKVQIKTSPRPNLSGRAKRSYEEALKLLHDSPHLKGKESEPISSQQSESSEPAPRHCHTQIISSLAALALIYVDLAQRADEAALSSLQNFDPESENAHKLLVSDFNKKAIALQSAVIDQQELLGGLSSRETLESVNTLGLIYQSAGLTEKAITQYELVQSLADEFSVLHFTSQSNLGTLLFAAGEFEKAETVQILAYEKREKYGEAVVGDKEFVKVVFNLALTTEELGRGDEALGLMGKALKLSRDAFGHSDPTTGRIFDMWREWSEGSGYV
jgi:tetratricopeptide (TPR) repeat protein